MCKVKYIVVSIEKELNKMKQLLQEQHTFFYSGATKSYAFRKKQLQRLKSMLKKYESNMYEALKLDLNKSQHEALTTEIGILYTEIDFTIKHLRKWMLKKEVDAPITHTGTKNYIMYEPYGTVLVIAPWNYPIQLAVAPIIGAIAAGNTVVLKPSEISEHTSQLLYTMFHETFDTSYISVVEGDKDVSEKLLEQRFDYIFFTGSPHVGRIVMEKASKYLTPITLELGGKSPAIVDKDCSIKRTAKRIIWGKFTNAGQTCVAPDYVYIHADIYPKLVKEMKKQINKLYTKQPLTNPDYVKIINNRHFHRLKKLLDSGTVIAGGDVDEEQEKIAPTLLEDITWFDDIMAKEIFGPLLPMMSFKNLDEVIAKIQQEEKPLALYYFGASDKTKDYILESLSFGGGCINDTLYHLANPHLPFGGVGTSGMGAYHGKYSFNTFSHEKSVMEQTTKMDIPVRYPGSKLAHSLVKKILK